MKQTTETALNIYRKIDGLKKELNEIGQACNAVQGELGKDHIGYTLLKKQYEDKQLELRRAENSRYTPYQEEKAQFTPN